MDPIHGQVMVIRSKWLIYKSLKFPSFVVFKRYSASHCASPFLSDDFEWHELDDPGFPTGRQWTLMNYTKFHGNHRKVCFTLAHINRSHCTFTCNVTVITSVTSVINQTCTVLCQSKKQRGRKQQTLSISPKRCALWNCDLCLQATTSVTEGKAPRSHWQLFRSSNTQTMTGEQWTTTLPCCA